MGLKAKGEMSLNSANPIATAIDAVVDHVEKYVDITGWDTAHQPTKEELAERRAGILAVASRLRALSKASEVRKISASEFDALISELFKAQLYGVISDDLTTVHQAIANS
jgi:hypothetical protein